MDHDELLSSELYLTMKQNALLQAYSNRFTLLITLVAGFHQHIISQSNYPRKFT